MKRHKSS